MLNSNYLLKDFDSLEVGVEALIIVCLNKAYKEKLVTIEREFYDSLPDDEKLKQVLGYVSMFVGARSFEGCQLGKIIRLFKERHPADYASVIGLLLSKADPEMVQIIRRMHE